jgi:hypothetical protein
MLICTQRVHCYKFGYKYQFSINCRMLICTQRVHCYKFGYKYQFSIICRMLVCTRKVHCYKFGYKYQFSINCRMLVCTQRVHCYKFGYKYQFSINCRMLVFTVVKPGQQECASRLIHEWPSTHCISDSRGQLCRSSRKCQFWVMSSETWWMIKVAKKHRILHQLMLAENLLFFISWSTGIFWENLMSEGKKKTVQFLFFLFWTRDIKRVIIDMLWHQWVNFGLLVQRAAISLKYPGYLYRNIQQHLVESGR